MDVSGEELQPRAAALDRLRLHLDAPGRQLHEPRLTQAPPDGRDRGELIDEVFGQLEETKGHLARARCAGEELERRNALLEERLAEAAERERELRGLLTREDAPAALACEAAESSERPAGPDLESAVARAREHLLERRRRLPAAPG